ncbi:MAG: tetraacyldisaccharide 4'-kinase [Acidobacteria bacterium]|nr:tetraacyldisaccharide 4'-kinase [Acidobacteriota bacterium]
MVESPLLRRLIYLPAQLYRLAVETRLFLYRRKILKSYRLNAPVISVGNLTVGGTGKTPCVAFIAGLLRDEGLSVAILSRGYKRKSSGIVEVSNEDRILTGPVEAGDEPFLLAQSCPGVRVIVDSDRYAAGRWIEQRAAIDLFILDDGFQHARLARDLNLLLVDATEPLEDARMVPLGRLREPLAGMDRADALIVTRSDRPFDRASLEAVIAACVRPGTPIFHARHEISGFIRLGADSSKLLSVFSIAGPVAALSGIARPDNFITDLAALGMQIVLRRDYPDHHRYTSAEVRDFVEAARKSGAMTVVTTEKDAANLPAEALADLSLPVYAARIAFRCDEEPALSALLLKSVTDVTQRQ